jgi:hypothetical protein
VFQSAGQGRGSHAHERSQRALPATTAHQPVAAYRKRGVDLILGGFLHFQEEIEYFGSRELPLVRESKIQKRIRSTSQY